MARDTATASATHVAAVPRDTTRVRGASAWLLLAAATALLTRTPDLFHHFVDWDEASMMAQGWAMTQGDVLYRDLPQIHGFLNIALFAPFFLIFSPDAAPHAIKLFNLCYVVAGSYLTFLIVRAWLNDVTGAGLAAVVYAFLLGRSWALSSYGEFYTTLPLLGATYMLFFSRAGFSVRMLSAGALFTAAFFLKQVAGIHALGIACGWLALGAHDRQGRLTGTLLQVAGGALVFAAIGSYFVAHDSAGAWLNSTFVRPLQYTATTERSLLRLALTIVRAIASSLGPAVLAAGVGFALLRRRAGAPSQFAGVVLLWLAAASLSLVASGYFWDHYLLYTTPPLVLGSVLCLDSVRDSRRHAVAAVVAAMLVAYAGLNGSARMLGLYGRGWTPEAVRASHEIAAAVRRHTTDRDRIFIYEAYNLDVFYLSGRRPAAGITMHLDMAEEHTGDPLVAERARQRLLANPPALIIAGTPTWAYPSNERFFEMLLGQYEAVESLEGVTIHRILQIADER